MEAKIQTLPVEVTPTTKTVIVRQYGLQEPSNWGPDCQEHLYMQNKLWNRLVEIERDHRAQYQAITSSDNAVAAKEASLNDLLARRAEAVANKKKLRAEQRSKKVDTTLYDRQVRECGDQIQVFKAELKVLRKEARTSNREALGKLDETRKEAVKEARNASGLWWGNYNAVCGSYDIARSKALKEGAELRFHRFDGTGRFTCQIQGGISPADLMASKHNIASLAPVDDEAFTHFSRGARRQLQRTALTITIYTGKNQDGNKTRRTLTFPMILHRPIPEDVLIKEIAVARKRVGTKFRWSATFICTRVEPAVERRHPSPYSCGINFGWRQVEGGIRVATIAGNDSEAVSHIILPAEVTSAFDHIDALKSQLDTGINEIHAVLKLLFVDDAPEGVLKDKLLTIRKAPKIGAGKLAGCCLEWRENHGAWQPNQLDLFEKWRKADKRKREEMDNLRDKMQRRRLEIYRCAAKQIAEKYGIICFDDFDLRGVVKVKTEDGSDNILPEKARQNRTRAAVSELRLWLKLQTVKSGSEIVLASGKTTAVHHECGAINDGLLRENIMQACAACGKQYDIDENAAKNCLALADSTQPAVAGISRKSAD